MYGYVSRQHEFEQVERLKRNDALLTELSVFEVSCILVGQALPENTKLSTLYIGNVEKSPGCAFCEPMLASNKSIEDLTIGWIDMRTAKALGEALKVNASIKKLMFEQARFQYEETPDGQSALGKALAEALKVNTTLTEIVGDYWPLMNDAATLALCEGLQSNSTLKELGLGHLDGQGGVAFGEYLRDTQTLKALRISRLEGPAEPAICEALKSNVSLREFSVMSFTEAMGDALKVNQGIAQLTLHNLDETQSACLGEALKVNKMLTSLNLRSIDAGGVPHVCQALESSTSVVALELDVCEDTGAEAGAALASLLRCSACLESLELTGISDAGASVFFESLRDNNTLTVFSFQRDDAGGGLVWGDDDDLDDDPPLFGEGHVLADALSSNQSLRTLKLLQVQDESWGSLCKMLESNVGMTTCDFSHQSLGREACEEIGVALRSNFTLKSLIVEDFRPDAIETLAAAVGNTAALQSLKVEAKLEDMVAASLFRALQTNQTIRVISVPCPRGDDAGHALRSLLLLNSTLTELDLRWDFASKARNVHDAREMNRICKHAFEALENNGMLSSLSLPCGDPNYEPDEGYDEIDDAMEALNKSLQTNTSLKTLTANVMVARAALALESAQRAVARNRVKYLLVSCAEVEPGEICCSTIAGEEVGQFSVPPEQPTFGDWLASEILKVRPLEADERLQLLSLDGAVLWPPSNAS